MHKRKGTLKVPLTILLIFITLIFAIDVVKAEEIPILESKKVSIVDDSGKLISGPELDINSSIIPISYNGSFMVPGPNFKDIKVIYPNTEEAVGYPGYVNNDYVRLPKGTLLKVSNVSYYQGETLTMNVLPDKMFYLFSIDRKTLTIANGLTGNNSEKASLKLEIWFEDSKGNKVIDPNLDFILPTYNTLMNTNSDYVETTIENKSGIKNMIFRKGNDQNFTKTFLEDSNLPYSIKIINGYKAAFSTNTVSSFLENNLILSNESKIGKYPNGTPSLQSAAAINFFGTTNVITVPLKLAAPDIIETQNDQSFKADIQVVQNLYQQSKDSFYPDSVDLFIKMPEGIKTKENLANLSITDKDSNDIKKNIVPTSPTDGTLKFSVSNSQLKSFGNNFIKVAGEFDLIDQNNQLINYFNQDTGYFDLPIEAYNSDNDSLKSTGLAKVKMPAPKGEPVPTTVELDSNTKDLIASELVTNLSSVLTEDKIEVVGIKENQSFTSLGATNITVQIKSSKTGVLGEVVVPVTVIEQEKAQLSWDKDKKTITKTEKVDKSDLESSLEETLYWQAPYVNKKYQIIVKDNQNKVLESVSTQEAKDITTWNSQSINLPVSLLAYNDNNLVVEIYALDNNDKPKGTPLDTINLELTMMGSLKIKTIPAQLKWTDRTSDQSVGILARDSGNAMTLSVVDTRNLSENQKEWSLRSKVTTTENVPLDLIWKDSGNSSGESLQQEQIVLTKEAATKDGDTYQKTWNENTGVLLSSADYLKVGDYSGKIIVNWNLYDTENPD